MTDKLLTDEEHDAIAMSAQLYNTICDSVIAHGPTREQDVAELAADIHRIQHRIMGQAAARQYPQSYRLLGDVLPRDQDQYT